MAMSSSTTTYNTTTTHVSPDKTYIHEASPYTYTHMEGLTFKIPLEMEPILRQLSNRGISQQATITMLISLVNNLQQRLEQHLAGAEYGASKELFSGKAGKWGRFFKIHGFT